MDKYRVKFTRTEAGYVDVFADNEDHAIKKLYDQSGCCNETIETSDCEYFRAKCLVGNTDVPV
jgi:hypothetical protein